MTSDLPSVLIVDDSRFVRRMLVELLESSGEFRVAGEAEDGLDAIRKVHALNPDLVTLDVQMPGLDGLQALGYIMSEAPRAVVMLTAAGDRRGDDLTLRALELGAVDFVRKPAPDEGLRADVLRERLLGALRGALRVNLSAAASVLARPVCARLRAAPVTRAATRVVAMAASTGGPRALAELIPALPPDLGAAVLIAQHMPAGFTGSLAERLDRRSALPVSEARDGDALMENRVYIAPGGRHLGVSSGADGTPRLVVRDDPPVHGVRPSADVLFKSVADVFGAAAVGIVLTGMGRDGADGLRWMRRAGAFGIVQDEATSTVYGMPKTALGGGADAIASLPEMAQAIAIALATRESRTDVTLPALPRS
ncbi:MAG TPA: chemotaxis-specific protein-glutamate methyltransferase CheB [Gemmatimonadaceae bacterium]